MIKKGDVLELTIDSVANGGEGIGRYEGIPVFVADTVEGDVVTVQVDSAKKNFAFGKLLEVKKGSEFRRKPPCGISKICGGCQFMHIDYQKQLDIKKDIVQDCLRKFAGTDIQVNETVGAADSLHYRCKIQYPVQQTKVSKRLLVGYYKRATHEIVNIKSCPIQPEIIDEITEFLREELKEAGINAYDERKRKGLLRHIVYRISSTDQKIMTVFVINSQSVPDEFSAIAAKLRETFPLVTGVLVNFNTAGTNVILGQKTQLIDGTDFIDEIIEGKRFRVSASSFFQVNPLVAGKLFSHVRDILSSRLEKPEILDVYAGGGTFSIFLSDLAKSVVAVEENASAVADAQRNIELNNLREPGKFTFVQGNADEVLLSMTEEGSKFDAVVLDPPRKGCSPSVIEATAELAKKYIVYVSCNPATLARDMKILEEKGFEAESVQPFDMFCNTYHVETVVLLKKKA